MNLRERIEEEIYKDYEEGRIEAWELRQLLRDLRSYFNDVECENDNYSY